MTHDSRDAVWSPRLSSISHESYEESQLIRLFTSLRTCLSFILGHEDGEYQAPISYESALLADQVLNKIIDRQSYKYSNPNFDIITLYSAKAANLYWPLGKLNESTDYYKKAAFHASKLGSKGDSALVHIYGNLAYIYNELGDLSSAKIYTDYAFQSISKLSRVDVDNLLWLINISSFYLDKFNTREELLATLPRFYEFFVEYTESRNSPGSSDSQWLD